MLIPFLLNNSPRSVLVFTYFMSGIDRKSQIRAPMGIIHRISPDVKHIFREKEAAGAIADGVSIPV